MKKSDFYFELPEELIAQSPMKERDHSRLLVLNRNNHSMKDDYFYDLGNYLKPGDTLVLNNTKVMPARLFGHRKDKEEKIEVLLLHPDENNHWECLVRPGRKMKVDTEIIFSDELSGVVRDITETGNRMIELQYQGNLYEILDRIGNMPLPPYITKTLEDKSQYQTIYSRHIGSSAAPTAGLHFTPELLEKLQEKGINIAYVTLHVGLGTFQPVRADNIEDHHMHSEHYHLPQETVEIIQQTKDRGNRVVAVGTTSVRTLESAASTGVLSAGEGDTDIFIYPGYKFKVVDAIVTNFHLPESTLMMLISAFYNREDIMKSYEHAISERYRFFSFGDAMFIE